MFVCVCEMGSNCLQEFCLHSEVEVTDDTGKQSGRICQSLLWKGADEDEDEEAASTHDCASL